MDPTPEEEEAALSSSKSPMLSPSAGRAVGAGAELDAALDDDDSSPPHTGTCPAHFWSCPGAAGFKVRGARYLRDHMKVRSSRPPAPII